MDTNKEHCDGPKYKIKIYCMTTGAEKSPEMQGLGLKRPTCSYSQVLK